MTNQNQDRLEASNDLAELLRGHLADAEHELEMVTGVMMSHGFIVQVEGLTMTFTIVDNQATNPRHCRIAEAVRFTRADAQAVAASVKNGNGTFGKAVYVRDALLEDVRSIKEQLARIEKIIEEIQHNA